MNPSFLTFTPTASHREEGLWLPFPKGRRWVPLAGIVLLEGIGNYTQLHFRDGSRLLVALTLKALTERLPKGAFARPHRKYLLNWQYIRLAHRHESEVILANGERFPIARRRMTSFLREYKGYATALTN